MQRECDDLDSRRRDDPGGGHGRPASGLQDLRRPDALARRQRPSGGGAGDRLAGIVSEADLMRIAAAGVQDPGLAALREDVRPPLARELMTPDVATVRPGATICKTVTCLLDLCR